MAWCPKCKCEYTPGITHCPDCDVDLVESLDTLDNEEYSAETEDSPSVDMVLDETNTETVNSDDEFIDEADIEERPLDKSEFVRAFVESSAREEEMKSSGISFLIVGIILLAVAVMIFLGIIPLGGSDGQKLFNTFIVGVFGIVFLVVSAVSYKRAKQLSVSSVREERLTEEIIEYCLANYKEPTTDESQEEEIYFVREHAIRDLIKNQFKGLDESYMDYLLDIIYSELYPEN